MCLRLVDVALQLVLLVQHLERGSSVALVVFLSAIIVCNALACVLMTCAKRLQSGLLQSVVDVMCAHSVTLHELCIG